MRPRVSVVMSVHNGERYLREAVDSILRQTLRDFEFLIVDDASEDATPEILASYAAQDRRVVILRNENNIGPYPSANRAIEIARAPLIARMDSDDISDPERFSRQVSFMDAHPDHVLVGTSYRSIDGEGRLRYQRPNPMDDFSVRWVSRFRMPMVHPSFLFRARYPDGSPVFYREDHHVAQDYALISDLLKAGRVAVLSDMLVDYRMHAVNISSTKKREQDKIAYEVSRQILLRESGSEMCERFDILHATLYGRRRKSPADISIARQAFDKLIDGLTPQNSEKWQRRRAAGILAETYLANERGANAFHWFTQLCIRAPTYIYPLLLRVMEIRGYKNIK
ncbi:glycosyltransferase family 2 protein [Litorisediminicola beolgyonensis]|uniref:Glycosyltransferase family 2 protein n=1 Tax=Litorisediminicola beolgyonensis TaxID=1173614 RepID=A0ABW3ZMU5_9RHOB